MLDEKKTLDDASLNYPNFLKLGPLIGPDKIKSYGKLEKLEKYD